MRSLTKKSIKFSKLLIPDQDYLNTYKHIKTTHLTASLHEHRCQIILGESGAGKSTLLEAYEREHNRPETDELSPKSVIRICPPWRISLPNVVSEILDAMGDPDPDSGTLRKRIKRIKVYKEKLGLSLLIIDEFHDMIPSNEIKTNSEVVVALKRLLCEIKIPLILAGTDRARAIIGIDRQISTRCNTPIYLTHFSMIDNQEATRFAVFMTNLLNRYPHPLPAYKNTRFLKDILLASQGNKRWIKALFTLAIEETPEGEQTTNELLLDLWKTVIPEEVRANVYATPFLSTENAVSNALKKLSLMP